MDIVGRNSKSKPNSRKEITEVVNIVCVCVCGGGGGGSLKIILGSLYHTYLVTYFFACRTGLIKLVSQ